VPSGPAQPPSRLATRPTPHYIQDTRAQVSPAQSKARAGSPRYSRNLLDSQADSASGRAPPGLDLRTVTCDGLVVGGFALASAHQQASVSGSLASSHAFWYGVLLALLIAWILPGWAAGVLFVIALLASDLLQSLVGHTHSSSSSNMLLLIVVVIALLAGLYFGRIRGLRQLGESDFRTRLRNVRIISRWL